MPTWRPRFGSWSALGHAGVVLALLLAATGAARAAAPSLLPGMPPEVKSWRIEILSNPGYRALVDEWQGYLDDHPRSAVAHVQLARAHRYARTASADERFELVHKGFELDPTCPEALVAMAAFSYGEHPSEHEPPSVEEAKEYATEAATRAPGWPIPHYELWILCELLDQPEEANEHLRALIRKGGFQAPVLDFGYNLLVSADSQAIVITNGDNDTYPPLALQAAYGTRTDVAIVNASLLNRVEYARKIWGASFGEDGPFAKSEIDEIHATWKQEPSKSPFAMSVIEALAEKVRVGAWTHPVYFAVTVVPAYRDLSPQRLEIEGLLFRITDEPRGEDESVRRGVNVTKTLRLFREEFRVESATDLSFDWTPTASATRLMTNYPAVLSKLAGELAAEGDLESVRYALRTSIRILDHLGEVERVRQLAEYWKELDPNSAEPDRWL